MSFFTDAMHIDIISTFFSHIWHLFADGGVNGNIVDGLKYLGAGISTISCVGSGIGQGYAAGKLAEAVARNPEVEGKARTNFIIGVAIAESGAIYGLVISLILIFVAK